MQAPTANFVSEAKCLHPLPQIKIAQKVQNRLNLAKEICVKMEPCSYRLPSTEIVCCFLLLGNQKSDLFMNIRAVLWLLQFTKAVFAVWHVSALQSLLVFQVEQMDKVTNFV